MISRDKMGACIARIRLMRHFPSADADLLGALAAELQDLCGDDSAVEELVKSLLQGSESWPGIYQLRSIADRQLRERERVAKTLRARAFRDAHEAGCIGYTIAIDEIERVVGVQLCRARFEGARGGYFGEHEFECRRHKQVDLDGLEAEELRKRGEGWISDADYYRRMLSEMESRNRAGLARR